MASVYDIHIPHLTVECVGSTHVRTTSARTQGSDRGDISVHCQPRILNPRSL